ncbi:MAG: sigma-70 family RNA polymerase sigma factor [Lachnospiraceae bacterium]|nr:sigma-70 family RNA polymerase sigma factor [Lachnospiraceae bacterium]MBR3003878.1 sigma-70 family RNA polymerase sigma factor [Lachnospiraceae bacterium]
MDDEKIISLYLDRNETAITETDQKYGTYCRRIAKNILESPEDIEECINDVWMAVWNRIPPLVPTSLKAFIGKITRDISISKYRQQHAAKRSGICLLLEELEECIPSDFNVEQQTEAKELERCINEWLLSQKKEERVLFIRRYYFGDSLKSLAKEYGCRENKMAQIMLRLRQSLKNEIEKWRQ